MVKDYLTGFLTYLASQKRYSQHTIQGYHTDLQAFTAYIEKKYEFSSLSEVNRIMVRDWLSFLRISGYSTRSIIRKKSALQSFFNHLVRIKKIPTSPMKGLPVPKVEKRLPVYVPEKEMLSMLDGLDFSENYKGVLERTIVVMLYLTGIRVSELVGVTHQNIDFSNQQLKVKGKGNKERYIPLHGKLLQTIQYYIKVKKKYITESAPANYAFFVSLSNKALSRQQVYTLCKKHLQDFAPQLGKKSPHVLRHTFATHLLQNGGDLNAIKELLGHASLAATQVYTHNDLSRIKEVYKKALPRK